jgi:hypothetical protein
MYGNIHYLLINSKVEEECLIREKGLLPGAQNAWNYLGKTLPTLHRTGQRTNESKTDETNITKEGYTSNISSLLGSGQGGEKCGN